MTGKIRVGVRQAASFCVVTEAADRMPTLQSPLPWQLGDVAPSASALAKRKCPGAGAPGQSLQQSASYRGHRFSSQPPRTKRLIAIASYPVVTEGAHLHRKKQTTIGADCPSVTFATQGEGISREEAHRTARRFLL